MMAVTLAPSARPSWRTASTVIEATRRVPPASSSTLAMASPALMAVMRAGIWLRALSFMGASPEWSLRVCRDIGWSDGGPDFAAVVELELVDRGGQDLGCDGGRPVDVHADAVAHEVNCADLSWPGVLLLSFGSVPGYRHPGGRDDREDRAGRRGSAAQLATAVQFKQGAAGGTAQQVHARQVRHVGLSRPGGHLGGPSRLHDRVVLDHDHPVAERHRVQQVV